ncbi:MAG: DNA mismatch repair endonuclease MutL [Anaerolineae bacterium]|nr:DNA mismatch repair endonuclease MutL [Anaerolineae bacterium]MDW8173269.1 DNA mismatch repair endonuclease MutL [Anaerolineae bacterium]
MTIKLLTEDVIAQIAAGEVVERPASVVKELIENALDAEARYIQIEVEQSGRRLIRVSDDGSGIRSAEVELAVLRHATSKLRQAEDLHAIRTLGFRGEALATIVAVSRTILMTRHREEQQGVELRLEGGALLSRKLIGVPAGTTVTVENLFYNTPARLKFLKTEVSEKRYIAQLVQNYALAYPHVRFVYLVDGREAFRSSGSGQLADVMVSAFGLETFRRMLPIQSEEVLRDGSLARAWGYTSLPEVYRSDRGRMILFINGRWVQDSGLSHAIVQAYQSLLAKGRYPYCVALVNLPPYFVDVNVHPAKAEVRFQDSNAVFALLQRSVRDAIVPVVQPGARRVDYADFAEKPIAGPKWALFEEGSTPSARVSSVSTSKARQRNFDVDEEDEEALIAHIPEGPGRPLLPRTLPPLRVVGQIGAAYIVTEGPSGMYLIDQNAAHQRVLVEQWARTLETGNLESQVVSGMVIDLPTAEMGLVERHHSLLLRLGFDVEIFGTNTVRLMRAPLCLGDQDAAAVLVSLVAALRQADDPLASSMARLAEWTAFRVGQVLSREEMQAVVRQLERCRQPFVSPAGRPTLIHMSAEQLTREFNRRPLG